MAMLPPKSNKTSPAWVAALPWLSVDAHTTTEAEVAELVAYFNGNAEELQEKEGSDSWTPLHTSVKRQRGEHAVALVNALLAAHPPAAEEKDKEGNVPLHLAGTVQDGEHGAAVVDALVTAKPETARAKEEEGWL